MEYRQKSTDQEFLAIIHQYIWDICFPITFVYHIFIITEPIQKQMEHVKLFIYIFHHISDHFFDAIIAEKSISQSFQALMDCRASNVLLLIFILGNTLAWDGCGDGFFGSGNNWKCGNLCIYDYAECKCGGRVFNVTAPMWCCQESNCTGKGRFNEEEYNAWTGEKDEEGRWIGADCIDGTALNLTEPCKQKCNFDEEDIYRNNWGVLRSHVPCNVTNRNITQCIPEGEMRDGKFDCENRADEEPFETGFGDSSSLLLDLENILTPCTDWRGDGGFKCSGNCRPLYRWCNQEYPKTCTELAGKTATGKMIDPQMCSNQTFWEGKGCPNSHNSVTSYRCTGDTPGQCDLGRGCMDGSSEIKEEQGEGCGEKLMCTARDGKFAGKKVCLEEKYKCDNFLQCEDGKDEEDCEREYLDKGIFTRNDWHRCRSPFLNITRTGKFFPMRAIRYNPAIKIVIIIFLSGVTEPPQCPLGDDEEGCLIHPHIRFALSLYHHQF